MRFRTVVMADGRELGLADAARLGGTAVELTVGSGQRGREACGHWLLGEVARRGNPADLATAGRAYRTALAAAESLGMRPLQAYCHPALLRGGSLLLDRLRLELL